LLCWFDAVDYVVQFTFSPDFEIQSRHNTSCNQQEHVFFETE
jgi:hypothetical protein